MSVAETVPASEMFKYFTPEERKERRKEAQARYYRKNREILNEANKARIRAYYEDPEKRFAIKRASVVFSLNSGTVKKPKEATLTTYAIRYDPATKRFF